MEEGVDATTKKLKIKRPASKRGGFFFVLLKDGF
jgi:hypothetical protein